MIRVGNVPVKFRKSADYDSRGWRAYDVFIAYEVGPGSEPVGRVVQDRGWSVVGGNGFRYPTRERAAIKAIATRATK